MPDERESPKAKPTASAELPVFGGSYVDGKLIERTQDPAPTPGGVIHREPEE
jgi:hypothetical protein